MLIYRVDSTHQPALHSFPTRRSSDLSDGTENHCVSSACRMNSARAFGSRLISGGTRRSWAPDANVPNTSNVERSKCSGGWPEMRSVGPRLKYRLAHSTKWITLRCGITTPFGVPVDPEVKRMCAGCAGLLR